LILEYFVKPEAEEIYTDIPFVFGLTQDSRITHS